MRRLYVWMQLPDATVQLVGELGISEPSLQNGRFQSEFEYALEWKESAGAFALDPESLPLYTLTGRFDADLFYPPLSIFDDCLPDDWGRSLLTTMLRREGRRPTPVEMLLRLRGAGTGALIFSETPSPPEATATVRSTALRTLLSAADRFEAGTLPFDDEFRKLLEGSSRAGGARPKALVHDKNGEWLVKFPSRFRDEGHDVVGLEATCLSLARRAGLEVPELHLLKVGPRRVLAVRRFDVSPRGGRLHMVSLRTLCRERPGIQAHAYSDLARAVRKHSASPAADVAALFRHMVFNAAIGNVDDHLKNFWMLRKVEGYRLAPAFDLVPDVMGRSEHTLSFDVSSACPRRNVLMKVADAWDVSDPARIIGQVAEAVDGFATEARKFRVRGARRLQRIVEDVRDRVARIRSRGNHVSR